MYRFIVLYVCIYVAPWSCEARHLVPLYVPTCSGMTIKLNLNLNLKFHNFPANGSYGLPQTQERKKKKKKRQKKK